MNKFFLVQFSLTSLLSSLFVKHNQDLKLYTRNYSFLILKGRYYVLHASLSNIMQEFVCRITAVHGKNTTTRPNGLPVTQLSLYILHVLQ